AVGQQVDTALTQGDVRLTMGGEPTFVPALPEAAEWNTAAMGEEKLGYARRMAAELLKEVYPGALAMQVFGKWYPGEPLPRWNILTMMKREGRPLWRSTGRLLLDDVEGANQKDSARQFMDCLAVRLKLRAFVLEAVEQDEGATPAGWVLPLHFGDNGWTSAEWPFSKQRPLKLFTGDSPVGLRLPLGDLPEGCLQTALTVEVRRGALEIFLPPLDWPAYGELIAQIHALVEELDLRDIVFCGYGPSKSGDHLTKVGLAADPGVLEVNLPACTRWEEYDRVLNHCARAAASVGLQLTKFLLNGNVYGTGGGAHLTFGGPDLENNPFLADPVRITSLLRYWQRHPALSYLFTGQYVGPGSQAPRVDEGPLHGLYELEVACEGIENAKTPPEGPDIDQFLKNLMTDSSGNTHRAELCFDKFYNLSQINGCLGLVEMRAFETFPNIATMSRLALFVRTVLARLFKSPFREPLIRFGPELHDRYFLPAFLWEDFGSICDDLKTHGFPFDPEWLRDAYEFRCPVIGRMDLCDKGRLEFRRAFESWPLMAEESRGSSMVRVVDNSSDRIQVTLSEASLLDEGTLLANGIEVPFKEVDGRMICGIRYKCASAYPALHPHVPIQSPLLLEWVDRKTGKTDEAIHYHYWHPDGDVYDGRPKTAEDAAGRRGERWLRAGQFIGREPVVHKPKLSPEYRFTLDLRRQLKA
ncbi:MAG TPA: transglutaminase family protein, partial [Opitutales bacterium]|nr:transglutaminase family protein [Opitutales bacterium]